MTPYSQNEIKERLEMNDKITQEECPDFFSKYLGRFDEEIEKFKETMRSLKRKTANVSKRIGNLF